ncbi:hypothetical protein [Micromonospora peucetia]|uniref:MobA-like NTP transferase domain-containing protein n=1 Tax=Micromonospora peucetia TaxID=47871 RepID=A0A1C6VE65_9ACTN|nr:hypothetical protein [Micromonospora peucetia]WSA30125.1 hypothetical protein OIE14_18075 [Micromonospora peucetia]SCL64324.1 hypothetical protein GA0070608_2934 [Micromonospora peucetia]
MARRVVVALLGPVAWAPPGIDPVDWRAALAEDVVDLLATLNEVETAVAVTPADRRLADAVVWPGTAVHEVPEVTPNAVFAALADSGYDQVAVIAGDAPDVPGLTIGKLLRTLTTQPVAVAPVEGGGPGLIGVAARLPVPAWLPALDLDTTRPAAVRAVAPRPGDLAVTPAWRRLRGPGDLAFLDPAVEGWETTRALLSGTARPR